MSRQSQKKERTQYFSMQTPGNETPRPAKKVKSDIDEKQMQEETQTARRELEYASSPPAEPAGKRQATKTVAMDVFCSYRGRLQRG